MQDISLEIRVTGMCGRRELNRSWIRRSGRVFCFFSHARGRKPYSPFYKALSQGDHTSEDRDSMLAPRSTSCFKVGRASPKWVRRVVGGPRKPLFLSGHLVYMRSNQPYSPATRSSCHTQGKPTSCSCSSINRPLFKVIRARLRYQITTECSSHDQRISFHLLRPSLGRCQTCLCRLQPSRVAGLIYQRDGNHSQFSTISIRLSNRFIKPVASGLKCINEFVGLLALF